MTLDGGERGHVAEPVARVPVSVAQRSKMPSQHAEDVSEVPVDRAAGGASTAILTTLDQVLSSASNAMIVFTLAQASSAEQFGMIALIVTVVAVCTGFTRGALGTPLLLTSDLPDRKIAAEAGYAVSWSLGMGIVAGVVILVGGIAIEQPAVAVAFAVVIPFALAQDVLRMAAIALGKPVRAVVADTLWTGVVLIIFVANLFDKGVSAPTTVFIWGAAGMVSAGLLLMWCRVRLRFDRIWEWWRTYYPARLRFGSLPASSQLGALLVTAAAVATVGSAAAAGVRGAMTLFGPITILISALPVIFVPRAARTRHSVDVRSQWRELNKTSLITSSMTLLATVALANLRFVLGSALLGETWTETQRLVPYVGIQWAAMCWLVSVYIFFQAQGVSKAIFWLNVCHMALQVTVCVIGGTLFGSAIAIGVALAISGWLVAGIGTVGVRMWIRRRDSDAGARSPVVDSVEGVVVE